MDSLEIIARNIEKESKDDGRNILVTPPARENTETDLGNRKGSSEDSLKSELINRGSSDKETNEEEHEHATYRRDVNGCIVLNTLDVNQQVLFDRRPSDISDVNEVLNEMKRILTYDKLSQKGLNGNDATHNDHDVYTDDANQEDEAYYEREILRITREDYGIGDKTPRPTTGETYTYTPQTYVGFGFTTRTLPELDFSWESGVTEASQRSGSEMSNYTNQYLRSSASIFGSRKLNARVRLADVRKREAGVRFNSRVDTRSQTRKLFCFTHVEDLKDHDKDLIRSSTTRNASRMALESREAMFRRAMSLLSARCTSVRQDGDAAGDKIGGPVPKYFYVTQDKPVPMEPLKAWRGYNGNIYFEPININPVKGDGESLERAKTSLPERPNDHARALTKPKTATDKDNRNASQDHRAESRQTTKSSVGAGSRRSSNRPGVYLDRQAVFTRYNDSIQEDLVWLEGQESTGSLAVRPKTYPDRPKDRDRDLQYNKERIRKGSVAHRLFVEKSKQKPKLTVSGGKFTPPNSLSPLLRTQTQYSLSSNRLTTNSPDLYHLNESKFPPLPRSAAKRESIPPKKMPYTRSLTITDDMKPFVKYSPDVVAKFSQPTNIC